MRSSGTWIVRTLGMTALVLAVAKPALAQHYAVTDLGTLPNASLSAGAGINNLGEVVGSSFASPLLYGFLYSNGTMVAIGTPARTPCNPNGRRAVAINDKGQVVYDSPITTSLWQNGVLTPLKLPANVTSAAGAGINSAGWIVGGAVLSQSSQSVQIGFLYKNGQFSNLGTLGGSYCFAHGINANGQVVGEASTSKGDIHAFVFQLDAGGKVVSRKDLGGPTGGSSAALAINISGESVGSVVTSSYNVFPVLYSNGRRTHLGLLPNMTGGVANAINAAGQIVGNEWGGTYLAFLYSNGVLHDLNHLISDPSWQLMQANGINDSGQIVGTGIHNGAEHAFLLTPQ